MGSTHLTDAIVKRLPAPPSGNRIHYDSTVKGFGCRVTTAGARAFVLSYRTNAGRDRRYTIGAFPDWTTAAARAEAKRLKLAIRVNGADPVGGLQAARGEKTVGDMIERYIEEHLPKKREGSQAEDLGLIRQWLIPLRHLRVAAVTIEDIDNLHRKITRTGTPYRANRVLALLSKMFALASTRWRWRPDNPCRGVERNQEIKRVRYLTAAELERLTMVLATYPDRQAANIVRMLLFTGARKGEVLTARWEDFDLERGVWTKPGASTKQKTEHRVPLSAPARQLLAEISLSRENSPETDFVFPGPRGADHRVDLKGPWPAMCKAAGIEGARVHDLRHTYASVLAGAGQSLPVIGALLGHTQPATTARYAHLLDDPLRAATETAGAILEGRPKATVSRARRP